jgi:hypothetical protein
MKYLFVALIGTGLLYSCTSNDAKTTDTRHTDSVNHAKQVDAANDSANFTSVQWLDSIHQELGQIKEGGVVEVSWRFKNTGNKPLIISNASASCGCTVAEKPEAPITPGGEGIIKAKFDSKDRPGMQRKDVYVLANTNGTTNHQLSFAVDVQKK